MRVAVRTYDDRKKTSNDLQSQVTIQMWIVGVPLVVFGGCVYYFLDHGMVLLIIGMVLAIATPLAFRPADLVYKRMKQEALRKFGEDVDVYKEPGDPAWATFVGSQEQKDLRAAQAIC